MKPEYLLNTLAKQWPILSAIFDLSEDGKIDDNILKTAYKLSVTDPTDKNYRQIVNNLENSGIIESKARGQRGYEININILPAIEYLRQQ